MKVIFLVFLTSQLDGSELTAARFGHFAAGSRTPLQIGLEGGLVVQQGKNGRKGKDFAFVKNRSPAPLSNL